MIYGLYLSAQGAEAQAMRQSVLANNMANAGTTAFKRDLAVFRAHQPFDVAQNQPTVVPETLNDQTGGVELFATITDHRQGSLTATNAPLDVAVVGPGFLQIANGNETALTRDGRMALDPTGQLVTADGGHPVLSTDGQPIVIPPETERVAIGGDGLVVGHNSDRTQAILGQLALVEPADIRQLVKRGNNTYVSPGPVQPAINAQVRQGVLEQSTSDPVEGMVTLIETARAFEMNMNLVRYQDEMLGQLIQSVPRR